MFANSTEAKSSERKSTRRMQEHRQEKPPVLFNIVVRGVGLEPSFTRRHRHLKRFSAAPSPFFSFFSWSTVLARKGLAGDELNESRKASQMPSVRKSEIVERRDSIYAFRPSTALFMPRLRTSFFKMVAIRHHSLFSFVDFRIGGLNGQFLV
jgi:hypothetical protein